MPDHAAAAGAIDHVHRLIEILLQQRGQHARHRVGAAARAPGHDECEWPRGILGGRKQVCSYCQRSCKRGAQRIFHVHCLCAWKFVSPAHSEHHFLSAERLPCRDLLFSFQSRE